MLHFSRWKSVMIWLTVLVSMIFAMPNLISDARLVTLPSWFPKDKMTLGLDLQGGSHIMLKVERADVIKDRLQSTIDDVRTKLREANIGYTGLSGSGQTVQVRVRDLTQIEAAKTALKPLTAVTAGGGLTTGAVTEVTMEDSPDGLIKFNVTDAGIDYRVASAATQSIEVVRRRVDQLGTTEPIIQRQGKDRIIVQVPGLQDPGRLKAILDKTAKLSFQMVDTTMSAQEAVNGRPPSTSEVLYSKPDEKTGEKSIPYLVEKRVLVGGESLVDSQASFNSQTNEPVVSFRFDSKGATRFAQATQTNVGKPFAIILDNEVISAPVIREPILGGSGQISGSFSVQGANDLAVLLRAGALPAKLTIVEERTVGPGLGADSIKAGVTSGIIGSILVVLFMLFFYGLFGVVANVALVFNVIMIIAVLSLIGSTLTLPGIAGIVLTIGMAVDSNVLIYERVREEFRNGRPVVQAIDIGFNKALATIVDANLTTLIAAVVLFFLGSGPVRGFSVTLAVGIVTTVFTAFTISRWLIAVWVQRRRPKALPKGIRSGMFDGTNIPFMGIRNYTFAISAALSIAALVGFFTVGMNLGIDFKGGSIIEVQAKQGDANPGKIREELGALKLGEVQVQGFGGTTDVLIRVQAQGGEEQDQAATNAIKSTLASEYDFRRVEVVGPSVSSELAYTGAVGVGIALLFILVYIWFRFEWQFALGAIIATVHDVILTIGMFVVTGTEFNLSSIAAVLTIVGYSLNDTVVVYDRMRESLRRYKKMPLPELIDTSINQTLSRTILTSCTTALALSALVLFGGEVIRSFTVAMLFGVVVGTFSSIYIAAPVLILFRLRSDNFREGQEGEELKGTDIVKPTA